MVKKFLNISYHEWNNAHEFVKRIFKRVFGDNTQKNFTLISISISNSKTAICRLSHFCEKPVCS